MTIGMDKPIIILNSSLLDLLDEEEMRFLIAHELGHAISGHAVYRSLKVWTVEQQLAFESVCGGVASKLAIAFDAGVRRSSHLESITDVLGSSIE